MFGERQSAAAFWGERDTQNSLNTSQNREPLEQKAEGCPYYQLQKPDLLEK